MSNEQKSIEIDDVAVDGRLTIWKACDVTNSRLAEAGVDKQLPKQMFYNYTMAQIKKGKQSMIDADGFDVETKTVSVDGFETWYAKYFEKNVTKKMAAAVSE